MLLTVYGPRLRAVLLSQCYSNFYENIFSKTQTYANLFYKIFAGGQGALHEEEENIHLFIKG